MADSLATAAADTEYKQSVFDICGEPASKTELGRVRAAHAEQR